MISFYPGPSRLYSSIPAFMQEACEKGVLSINHRSPEFVEISKKLISLLKQKLRIPEDYTIFFTSSATECWEIIAQSLIKEKSFHLYNGAFGEKWMEYTQKLRPQARGKQFGLEEIIDPDYLPVLEDAELIALTQNETSNGTELSTDTLRSYRLRYPQKLIAVDATSSMAGVLLEFDQADVWFASVQKCFGLPAGMALMICSPAAVRKGLEIGEKDHYNSFTAMVERMKDFQTTYTPNVLGIFLLMKVMEMVPDIRETDANQRKNAGLWYAMLREMKEMKLLIENNAVRSGTVIALSGEEGLISRLKKEAKIEGILLGNGYGQWKANTVRIANFPAIEPQEFHKLKDFLTRFGLIV